MDTRISVIDKRLQNINRIIAVASGKGGVGKSLVASFLSILLTEQGKKVGLLDLDLYGPSSHIILGAKPSQFPEEDKGIIPPKIHNISFMSIVYFSEDKPSPFRGQDITNIIIELLAITQWGPLDYLIIDMPPGIGEEILDTIHYIKRAEFLVVSTPSKVALGAVGKLTSILQEMNLPLLGILENMAMTSTTSIEDNVKKMGIPYIGAIKYDSKLETALGDVQALSNTEAFKDFITAMISLDIN